MKKGDMIKSPGGQIAIVTGDPYTKRFMEEQDWEMERHGMGEYAGIYASAVPIMYPKTGKRRVMRLSAMSHWERIGTHATDETAVV